MTSKVSRRPRLPPPAVRQLARHFVYGAALFGGLGLSGVLVEVMEGPSAVTASLQCMNTVLLLTGIAYACEAAGFYGLGRWASRIARVYFISMTPHFIDTFGHVGMIESVEVRRAFGLDRSQKNRRDK